MIKIIAATPVHGSAYPYPKTVSKLVLRYSKSIKRPMRRNS